MQKSISLEDLATLTCEASGVKLESLLGSESRSIVNIARGVFLMLAKELGFRVTDTSNYIGRTHASCIITANRYKGYYETKDKQICEIVNKVKEAMNG